MKFYDLKTLKEGRFEGGAVQASWFTLVWDVSSIIVCALIVILCTALASKAWIALVSIFGLIILWFVISFPIFVYLVSCEAYLGPWDEED